jgi:hypothetical protein
MCQRFWNFQCQLATIFNWEMYILFVIFEFKYFAQNKFQTIETGDDFVPDRYISYSQHKNYSRLQKKNAREVFLVFISGTHWFKRKCKQETIQKSNDKPFLVKLQ